MRTGVPARAEEPVGGACVRGCANRHKCEDRGTRNVNVCKIVKVLGSVINGYFMSHTYRE